MILSPIINHKVKRQKEQQQQNQKRKKKPKREEINLSIETRLMNKFINVANLEGCSMYSMCMRLNPSFLRKKKNTDTGEYRNKLQKQSRT